jgi:hypothetical protein
MYTIPLIILNLILIVSCGFKAPPTPFLPEPQSQVDYEINLRSTQQNDEKDLDKNKIQPFTRGLK